MTLEELLCALILEAADAVKPRDRMVVASPMLKLRRQMAEKGYALGYFIVPPVVTLQEHSWWNVVSRLQPLGPKGIGSTKTPRGC